MLYMIKDGVAPRLCEFVKNGGILISGFMSGYVDSDALCCTGGFPGAGLLRLFGLHNEEIDTLYPEDKNRILFGDNEYEVFDYCEIIHPDTAEVLAKYKEDFYAGNPAMTVNSCGSGKAYYIACRTDERFIERFYSEITANIRLAKAEIHFPKGLSVRTRENDTAVYCFVQNWNDNSVRITLKSEFKNVDTGIRLKGEISLDKYETLILKQMKAGYVD